MKKAEDDLMLYDDESLGLERCCYTKALALTAAGAGK